MPQTSLAPALELPPLSLREQEGLRTRIREGSFDAFADTLARVGNCAHPIRLFGHSHTINPATGEILSTYNSDTQPLGLTYIACGNRRASVCPACARTYARDTFEMIRSGVTGGKTVPRQCGWQSPCVRHSHRPKLRPRPRHPQQRPLQTWAAWALFPWAAIDLPPRPRPWRRVSGPTSMRSVLRLHHPRRVAVVGP